MSRPQRVFSATQFPPDIPESVRAVLQGFAQSIDQLVSASIQNVPATSMPDIKDGLPAANFGGVYLIGTFTGTTAQTFGHKLNRTPVGAMPILAVPRPDQRTVPVAQVAGAFSILSATRSQIVMVSTVANLQFTLILF